MDAVLIVFTLAALHPDAMHGMLTRAWQVCLQVDDCVPYHLLDTP